MFLVKLIIVQMIIFGGVIYFLKKLLYGDTESAVNRLDQSYKETTQKKQEMAEKIFQMEQEYVKKREEAEKLAQDLKEKAEEESREKADGIVKKAKEEAEKIVVDAQKMTEKMRAAIKEEERNNMISRCADLLNSVLKDIIREKINDALIEDFMNDFSQVDTSHVSASLSEIEVVFSSGIGKSLMDKVQKAIREKIPGKYEITERVDENILAGMIIKFGSLSLDGSLQSKIMEESQKQIEEKPEEDQTEDARPEDGTGIEPAEEGPLPEEEGQAEGGEADGSDGQAQQKDG